MKVVIVVTHLLGTGHLRRAINLSTEFTASGHNVTLVSGGLPVKTFDTPGFSLLQLPPLCSDGTNFTRLLNADGSVANEATMQERENKLKALIQNLQPDILITELFPFGRRTLRREFLGLLEAAQALRNVPVILSSVRDILASPSSEKKAQTTEELVVKYYDGVVVHSNSDTTPLNVSWPVTDLIQEKLFYTGYVAQSVSNYQPKQHTSEVIVSAGGGSVGRHIYETAIKSSRLLKDRRWRLLIGGSDTQSEVTRLKALARESPTVIEPNRPDFRELLSGALCSVSMCGYNTAIDLLLTGTPGVLVPFDAGGEQEQTLRARSLSERSAYADAYALLLAKDLTPESLCSAVEQASGAGRFTIDKNQFNGALETVRFATRLAKLK